MNEDAPLELELNSYVDGALDDEAMAAVEKYVQTQPQAAAKVRDYLQQKTHIRTFAQASVATAASTVIDGLEKQLARRLKRRPLRSWRTVAVLALLFAAGWIGHAVYVPMIEGPSYTDEVIQAHVLASSAPFEATPLSPEAVAQMFALIGEQQRVPDLRTLGLEPRSAKLLPSDEGPVLQVAYRNAAGTIVSFFLLHDDHPEEVRRHIVHRSGITLIYWQHDRSRYAVAAPLGDEQLELIANLVDPASPI